MAAITYEKHRAVLEVPYNQAFVDALKLAVPSGYRSWQDTSRQWIIYQPHVATARKLAKLYFGDGLVERDYENFEFAEAARKARDENDRFRDMYRENEELRRRAEEFQRRYAHSQNRQREDEYQRSYPGATGSSTGWFAALFVTPSAPFEVIEAAYKALARLYHPDNGGDTAKMQEVNAAYAALKKAKAR